MKQTNNGHAAFFLLHFSFAEHHQPRSRLHFLVVRWILRYLQHLRYDHDHPLHHQEHYRMCVLMNHALNMTCVM